MKKLKFCLTALFLLLGTLMLGGTGFVWAHNDDKTPDQSLTGEVVCLSCYLGHGGMGDIHAKCAKQCFAKGLPVGLKVGEILYLVVGERHGTANKMLEAYAGKQVTVSGHVFEQEGMSMVEVEKVEKAVSTVTTNSTDSTAGNATHKTYACPMDGYTSDKPGKCPNCGMDLVEKKPGSPY